MVVAIGEDAEAQEETVVDGEIEDVEEGAEEAAEGGGEGNEMLLGNTLGREISPAELRNDARLHWKMHSLAGVHQDSTAHQECNLLHKWLGRNEKTVQLWRKLELYNHHIESTEQ